MTLLPLSEGITTTVIPLPILAVPTPDDVAAAFDAAGIRPVVFRDRLEFGIDPRVDWTRARQAWDMMQNLPGGESALKRHLTA